MGPFYPLSSGPDGGPDKGLKSCPDETRMRNGAFLPTFFRTRWRTGQGVKISSGNAGFERAVLPGASYCLFPSEVFSVSKMRGKFLKILIRRSQRGDGFVIKRVAPLFHFFQFEVDKKLDWIIGH